MNHIGTREIATERLTLRRFEIEDAENMFYNWANDPEVTNILHGRRMRVLILQRLF